MAIYRQIHTHIWDDPKFEEYSPSAKLLFVYGFSNKHRNESGLYTITIRKMAFETGLTIEQTEQAVKEIVDSGSWEYDWDNHVLWVKNALKYQSVGSKTVIAILKDINTINSSLVNPFKDYYKDILYPIDTLSIPHSEPIETLADKGKGNDKGKVKDNDKGKESPLTPQGEKSTVRHPFKSKKQEEMFESFWDVYPKKKSKGQAEKAWLKIPLDDILFKKILNGLDKARGSPQWKNDNGQYIPYPASWLNAKGWEDEYGGQCYRKEESNEYPDNW